MSQLPPDSEKMTYSDFVTYAKFKLSLDKHLLMEDPIWERYTDEQVLIEYFAGLFDRSKEERDKFLGKLKLSSSENYDFSEWADRMMEDTEKTMREKAEKLEDKISFTPETLGDV